LTHVVPELPTQELHDSEKLKESSDPSVASKEDLPLAPVPVPAPVAPAVSQTAIGRLVESPDPAIQRRALAQLAESLGRATGDDGERLGHELRESKAVPKLLALLQHNSAREDVIFVIANLASDSIDPEAGQTRQMLHAHGAIKKVLPSLYVDTGTGRLRLYTLGAIQNLCTNRKHGKLLRRLGIEPRLRELVNRGGLCEQYALGCLCNIEAVLSPTFSSAMRV